MNGFVFNEPGAFLPDDLRMIRGQIRRYVEEIIVPNGDAWEQAGEIPREAFRGFGKLGFLGMRHPAEYGGGGLGPMASVVLGEECGRSTYRGH
jgi:acyl-CoA dehydrogenase